MAPSAKNPHTIEFDGQRACCTIMTETEQRRLDEILHTKLNLETSQIPWSELLRFFASGMVIVVARELDMVEVAVQMANDNKQVVMQWLDQGLIVKVSDEQAQAWLDGNASLWTVVVKPWILVQEEKPQIH